MGTLTDLRTGLEKLLTDTGIRAAAALPEAVTPPIVLIGPGIPYLAYEGATFGGVIVRHQLVAVVAAGVNDVATAALDDLITDVLSADLGDHVVEQVNLPGQVALNGQTHLGVAIDVATETRL